MKTLALRLPLLRLPLFHLPLPSQTRFASAWLVSFFVALFLAVVYVWVDQGILGIWDAYQAESISGRTASLITAFMLLLCAAHAWLFVRAYQWLVEP